jgi:pyrroline-5-carboxylate reductase
MIETTRIGFLGGGAMGQALLRGLIARGVAPAQLAVADPAEECREVAIALGARAYQENRDLVHESDVVVLAVKPQVLPTLLRGLCSIGDDALRGALWISIAAGVTLEALADELPKAARIIRAMPNTPAQVSAGATAFVANASAAQSDRSLAKTGCECVGMAWEAPNEALLDAVTGLSGSGPAYVFVFIEALGDAGVRAGLPRDAAYRLAAQTVMGSAHLVLESGRHPADLKDQVTSPGGTTIAGLGELEAAGFRAAVGRAVAAAVERSRELGASR